METAIVPNSLDYGIIAAVLGLALVAGIAGALYSNDTASYAASRRKSPFSLMMLKSFATGDGARSPLHGMSLSGLFFPLLLVVQIGLLPVIWVTTRILRRTRSYTTADLFGHRFGPATAVLYSTFGLLAGAVFISATLFTASNVLNDLTQRPLDTVAARLSIPLPEISFILTSPELKESESAESKSRIVFSVHWRQMTGTDLLAAILAIVLVTIVVAGGAEATLTSSLVWAPVMILGSAAFIVNRHEILQVIQQTESFPQLNIPTALMMALSMGLGLIAIPQLNVLSAAGRTEDSVRRGITVGFALRAALLCGLWLAIAPAWSQNVSAGHAEEKTAAAEQVSSDHTINPEMTSDNSIPAGILGLVCAAVIAATISSTDICLVACAGLATENIYKRHIAPAQSERHYSAVIRAMTLGVLAGALALRIVFRDMHEMLTVMTGLPAVMGISLWAGLFWRRWNALSVWISTFAGLAVWGLLRIQPDLVRIIMPQAEALLTDRGTRGDLSADFLQLGAVLTVTVCSGFLTSMMTNEQPSQQLDPFFLLLRTPVGDQEVLPAPCMIPDQAGPAIPALEFGALEWPRPGKGEVVEFAACVFLTMLGVAAAGFVLF
ncbi:MAG: hypothetical protein KDA81_03950 [Planctomycetaceae bacterium]|nr:hypothetical protein [Planctomycetaceae bacterium]